MEMESEYAGYLVNNANELTRLKRNRNWVVVLRIAMFILILLAIYGAIKIDPYFAVAAVIALALFLFLVRKAGVIESNIEQTIALNICIENEINALKGKLVDWKVNPSTAGHPWALDLDVFGPVSLFGVLNRSSDVLGQSWLSNELLHASVNHSTLLHRRSIVEAMSMNHTWRLQLQAASYLQAADEKDLEQFYHWLNNDIAFPNLKMLIHAAPFYGLIGVALAFTDLLSTQAMFLFWAVPLAITGIFMSASNRVASSLGKQVEMLKSSSLLFHHACSADDATLQSSPAFETMQQGVQAMAHLARIASDFDQRNNVFAAIVTNALYLSDLRNALRASTWRKTHQQDAKKWFDALAEVQGLMSIANFRANFRHQCAWPVFKDDVVLKLKGGGHPFMLAAGMVRNDINLSTTSPVIILTGANMAGKSTYLRMIGINVLLAKIGAPVVAESAVVGNVRLFSSMRTHDSLQAGKSYFYAELERLVQLLNELETHPNTLVLLDEILKGTNSNDKEAGSKAFVEKLARKKVLTLVATHDTSLCELEHSDLGIVNHHFASYVKNDDLSFDYKLQTGVCDTMNATWLMMHMGIIDKE